MEKINISQFQTKDLRINETNKDVLNNSIIEYGVQEDHFIQNTYVKNSPYHSQKQYHKSNYQLKSESEYFFNIPIGKLKKFDKSGLLLEEIEWNKIEQRKFSIDQLINKMNKEFNINLLNAENKNISRSTSPFTYIITIGNPSISSKVRRIIVNGQAESDISCTSNKATILANGFIDTTSAHELSHAAGLYHSFSNSGILTRTKDLTDNICGLF